MVTTKESAVQAEDWEGSDCGTLERAFQEVAYVQKNPRAHKN